MYEVARRWKAGLILISLALVAVHAGNEIECYSCSSNIDESCISRPSTTTSCSTAHGRGCATRLLDGLVERGCSSIGLSPSGCRVSEIAGTECVCHTERCNTRTTVEAAYTPKGQSTLSCYQCDSQQDSQCTHDIDADNTKLNTCPAANGCYLNKRVDEYGVMLYHRLCFNETAPATYYPGGCYTVFNKHSSTTSEVCVCYTDRCNQNSLTSLQSLKVKESEQVSSSTRTCLPFGLLASTLMVMFSHL